MFATSIVPLKKRAKVMLLCKPTDPLDTLTTESLSDISTSYDLDTYEQELFQINYRACPESAILSLCFTNASRGVIHHSYEVAPELLAGYSATGRIVCVDVDTDLARMPCHLMEGPEWVDGRPPLREVLSGYDALIDTLSVYFGDPDSITERVASGDADIVVGRCASGSLGALFFRNAARRLLVPPMGWADAARGVRQG